VQHLPRDYTACKESAAAREEQKWQPRPIHHFP
jgi:hypothetical protein